MALHRRSRWPTASIAERITAALNALRAARVDGDLSAEFGSEVVMNNLLERYGQGER